MEAPALITTDSEMHDDPNPPCGSRGHFRKVTITLSPETYARLVSESTRRKIAGERNHPFSALIREALYSYLPK